MGRKYRVHHDFETFSWVNLKSRGVDAYARHHSTEVLMLAWAVDDGPVRQWVPLEDGPELPQEFVDYLMDPDAVLFAWNKPFEWNIWKHVMGWDIPHDRWRDPMVLASSLSLPMKLEKANAVLRIPDDKRKMTSGSVLLNTFTKRRKPSKHKPWRRNMPWHEPERWEEFKLYNRIDVEAERASYKRMRKYDLPAHEWELWNLDQDINDKGIPVDLRMVDGAAEIYEGVKGHYIDQMRELTGLANPNSDQQILGWLQERGYPFNDVTKAHVQRAMDRAKEDIDGGKVNDVQSRLDIIEACRLRLEAKQTSPTKFKALAKRVDRDAEVVRNTLVFAGAGRTWRWAGRGFQVHNPPRPEKQFENTENMEALIERLRAGNPDALFDAYDKPMAALKSAVRPSLRAPDGYVFIDADLSAIENVVLGWMADCTKILNVFRNDRDPYISFSVDLFGGTYAKNWDEYKSGDSHKRTISKPGVLGCGYMLGAGEEKEDEKTGEIERTGLLGYAHNMQVTEFTLADSIKSVKTFRSTFPEVPDFWKGIQKAAMRTVRTGKKTEFQMLEFDIRGPFLRMRLPSGRYLHYCRPKIMPWRTPWGEMRPSLTYEGIVKHAWRRQSTHPGKLTENADQAIARDILAEGMMRASREGLDLRLHVHDQLLGVSKEDRAEAELKLLIQCLEVVPEWAKGLPLKANGFTSKFFTKD